jgi:hypothetical protein
MRGYRNPDKSRSQAVGVKVSPYKSEKLCSVALKVIEIKKSDKGPWANARLSICWAGYGN